MPITDAVEVAPKTVQHSESGFVAVVAEAEPGGMAGVDLKGKFSINETAEVNGQTVVVNVRKHMLRYTGDYATFLDAKTNGSDVLEALIVAKLAIAKAWNQGTPILQALIDVATQRQ